MVETATAGIFRSPGAPVSYYLGEQGVRQLMHSRQQRNPWWEYEVGESPGWPKHKWGRDCAGFRPPNRRPIGKCPKSIDQQTAEKILNSGFPWGRADPGGYPKRIYCTYAGVIYEAVPTRPGISYHGYPWRGDLNGRQPIPSRILRGLRQQAAGQGYEREFQKWLTTYTR